MNNPKIGLHKKIKKIVIKINKATFYRGYAYFLTP